MYVEQPLLPLVVLGLVVGTLILAALTNRHQQHQTARRAIVQRMENAIRRIEWALDVLVEVPLDKDLRQALRRDVLDRYRMIGDMFKRYPGLSHQLQQANAKLKGEQGGYSQRMKAPTDEFALRKQVQALDDLRSYLEVDGTLHPLSVHQRQLFVQQLVESSAELLADFYHAKFSRLVGDGQLQEGRAVMMQLITLLANRGFDTDRLRELRQAAEKSIKGDDSTARVAHSVRQAS